jgi:hypothetical protein
MLPSKRENALGLMPSLCASSKLLLMPEKNIEVAQQQQKYYADLKRRPVEVFDVDVKVLLCTKNLHIRKGSTKKHLPRYIGPLTITEQVNPVAFRLDLPNRLRMHNVFHVSLLRVYKEGKHPRSPDIPECFEGEYEYNVESIKDHRYVQSG